MIRCLCRVSATLQMERTSISDLLCATLLHCPQQICTCLGYLHLSCGSPTSPSHSLYVLVRIGPCCSAMASCMASGARVVIANARALYPGTRKQVALGRGRGCFSCAPVSLPLVLGMQTNGLTRRCGVRSARLGQCFTVDRCIGEAASLARFVFGKPFQTGIRLSARCERVDVVECVVYRRMRGGAGQ